LCKTIKIFFVNPFSFVYFSQNRMGSGFAGTHAEMHSRKGFQRIGQIAMTQIKALKYRQSLIPCGLQRF
jgi:hypothetical protein